MDVHFKVLGWIFIVVGVFELLAGMLFVPMIFGFAEMSKEISAGTQSLGHSGPGSVVGPIGPFFEMFGGMLGVMLLAWIAEAVASVVAGIGLLARKLWARPLIIILSIISLFQVPIGTAIGVYGLWAMFQSTAPSAWDEYVRGTQRTEMPAG